MRTRFCTAVLLGTLVRNFKANGQAVLVLALVLKHIECQRTSLESLFSVKLSDNSKILIVLNYHNTSTMERDKLGIN